MRFWNNPRVLMLIIAILCASLLGASYLYFYSPVTTVILVRHAEKNIEPNNPNPTLSPAGEQRAQELERMLANSGITAIYVTQYQRTQQTGQPLAKRLGVKSIQVESSNPQEVVRQIKASRADRSILVVGHNNTVPAIVAGLGGGDYPVIPETEYDNMFVVTLYRFGKAKTIQLKYGSPIPAAGNQMMTTP
ncbi:MAG TPA: phosphoglycerate mutase family protein [Pyrinomonadaceae bacterium]|nr:phosphoglycerate mutase family protein [Pyrinomonadaceae bacterium]